MQGESLQICKVTYKSSKLHIIKIIVLESMWTEFPKVVDQPSAEQYEFISLRALASEQDRERLIEMAEAFEADTDSMGINLDRAYQADFIRGYRTPREYIEAVEFSKSGRETFLLRHKSSGDFVGVRTFYASAYEGHPHEFDVSNSTTYVAPYARGLNLGKLSLEQLRQSAADRQLDHTVLEVTKDNLPSVSNLDFMVEAGLAKPTKGLGKNTSGKRYYEFDVAADRSLFWQALSAHEFNKRAALEPAQ